MSRPYTHETEAYRDVVDALVEAEVGHLQGLRDALYLIVHKTYRAGTEHGLSIGSRTAGDFADAAFARGFMEGQKHGITLADLGTVCENHLADKSP